jgi:LysM repeat protein
MTDSIDGTFDHHGDILNHDATDHSWGHAGVDDTMAPLGASESSTLGAIYGEPAAASQDWFLQAGNGYCLPASLTQVVSEVSGVDLPDESLIDARLSELGTDPGPNGLPLAAGVPLLQSYGIEAHVEQGASLGELANYLNEGRSIILGVNADEIWYGQNDPTDNPSGGANHAVVVTAIDTTDGVVVLSDPGNPDGNEETVPLTAFEEAWAAGDNQLLVVDSPTAADAQSPDVQPAVDHTDDAPGHDQAPTPTPQLAPGPVVMPMTIIVPVVIDAGTQTTTAPSASGPYTVTPGDTLWDIAERVYGDGTQYTRIAEANGLTNPDLITPGETLVIPQ